jgi:hypothetical protein
VTNASDVNSVLAGLRSPDASTRYETLLRLDRSILKDERVAQMVAQLATSDPEARVRGMAEVLAPPTSHPVPAARPTGSGVIQCPYCAKELWESLEYCVYCGRSMSPLAG